MTFMIEVTPSFAVFAVIIGPGPQRVDFSTLVSVNSSCMPKNIRFLEQHHRIELIVFSLMLTIDAVTMLRKRHLTSEVALLPTLFLHALFLKFWQESRCLVFTPSPPAPTKLDIRHFHVVVVQ